METTIVPSEVWIHICGHLSKPDLKALRLSGNHHLGSLASSLLLTTAYIAARKGVLNTFMALTTHSEFCNYVEEVVYDSSYISLDVVDQHRNEKSGSTLATLFKEREDIHSRELQQSLDRAFKCLSNIKSVRYSDMSRVAYLPGDFNNLSSECQAYHDGPLIHRIQSTCSKSDENYCSLRPATACSSHNDNEHTHPELRGFVALMQALTNRIASGLLHLSLGHRNHAARTGGISYWFFSRSNVEITHPFHPVFSSLRKLDLTISCDWPAGSQQQRCSTNQERSEDAATTAAQERFDSIDLATLLCSAQNLQEVELTGQSLTYSLRLADTFASHTWSNLRAVTLRYFEGSSQDLEDFVKRHTKSLQDLLIDYFLLTSGTWKALEAALPAIAPNVEIIFGLVFSGNRCYNIFPLADEYFDESGLNINGARRELTEEDEDGDGDEDSDEAEDLASESESDRLSCSSDDSSASTASNPRRKPDSDLLSTLTPEMRDKVEYIRKALPGCPADHCRNMLIKTKGDREAARRLLFRRFGYTQVECLGPVKGAQLERLIDEMPFDVYEDEAIRALKGVGWDTESAKDCLRQMYGHRQKIFIGGRR